MNMSMLRALGFDESRHVPFTRDYRVGCSQCQALAINGRPTHEADCPNIVKRCRECGNLDPDGACCREEG